ncbi:MAG TPA: type II toxin-antitoxin system VapC family toxin [Candidatus Sulfotelmatobacter sp.]|nr:type II toxin-antitoxin system VapC family toxin [Candidatus Sulfotelmatobacter sp.]
MSQFVLDASVVLTWCFPDENSAVAQKIALRFEQGDSAIAPSFWPHEVLNALLVGEKRKRISDSLIRTFLADLVKLPVGIMHTPPNAVFGRIQSLSRQHRLTAYDAAYLDLAHESGFSLATLDQELVRASREAGIRLL